MKAKKFFSDILILSEDKIKPHPVCLSVFCNEAEVRDILSVFSSQTGNQTDSLLSQMDFPQVA